MNNLIRKTFIQSIPVMAGYISLGIAYGILMEAAGYNVLLTLLMSTCIFAGSAQFLAVELMAAHATLPQTALLVFLLNFRHFFYGISMISRYRETGLRRLYLIFGLTDETYAILAGGKVPDGLNPEDYYLALTLMNHIWWVLGSVIGVLAGGFITFDTSGIDFTMTALFAVLVVEQWKSQKQHFPALLGFVVTIISLILFGSDSFLIPALIVISVVLLCFQNKHGRGVTEQ